MAAIWIFFGAGAAAVFTATIVVIIGVHQEERRKTIVRGLRPPTVCAVVARWILGAHFYLIPEERPEHEEQPPEEELPWFARSQPPKRPLGPGGHR
jgi:hypothetical protein